MHKYWNVQNGLWRQVVDLNLTVVKKSFQKRACGHWKVVLQKRSKQNDLGIPRSWKILPLGTPPTKSPSDRRKNVRSITSKLSEEHLLRSHGALPPDDFSPSRFLFSPLPEFEGSPSQSPGGSWCSRATGVTSQFSSLLKKIQGNPLEHSPLSKSEIFSMEYSRISNK